MIHELFSLVAICIKLIKAFLYLWALELFSTAMLVTMHAFSWFAICLFWSLHILLSTANLAQGQRHHSFSFHLVPHNADNYWLSRYLLELTEKTGQNFIFILNVQCYDFRFRYFNHVEFQTGQNYWITCFLEPVYRNGLFPGSINMLFYIGLLVFTQFLSITSCRLINI